MLSNTLFTDFECICFNSSYHLCSIPLITFSSLCLLHRQLFKKLEEKEVAHAYMRILWANVDSLEYSHKLVADVPQNSRNICIYFCQLSHQ